MKNLFNLPALLPKAAESEIFETLHQNTNIKIERIISTGQASKEWYDQPQDEWVILLSGEAKLLLENEGERNLKAGDYLFIPAHQRHRVTYTSEEPACVWLAVHF